MTRNHLGGTKRLESQVKEHNKDLGRLNALFHGKKMKKNVICRRGTNWIRKENQI